MSTSEPPRRRQAAGFANRNWHYGTSICSRIVEAPENGILWFELEVLFLKAKLAQNERRRNQIAAHISDQATFHAAGAGALPAEEAFTDLEAIQQSIEDLLARISKAENKLLEKAGLNAWDQRQADRDRQRAAGPMQLGSGGRRARCPID